MDNSSKKDNELNELVKNALILLSMNDKGVRQTHMKTLLSIQHNRDLINLIRKLHKVEGFSRYTMLNEDNTEEYLLQYHPNNDQDKKQSLNSTDEIKKLSKIMVDQYIKRHETVNKQLRKRLTNEFLESKSLMSVLYGNPEYPKIAIMRHIITDERLPLELKKLENEGVLHTNIECSLYIALFAVNHYEWNGQSDIKNNVINLALSISKYLREDEELDQKFESGK